MGVRGSALSRAIKYFKEGDIDEVDYVLQRGNEIVAGRKGPKAKKPAKSKRRKAMTQDAAEQAAQG